MIEKISFIGAGSMAEAVIAGILGQGVVNHKHVYVSNKQNEERLEELRQKFNIIGSTNKQEVIKDANIIVFATKPNDLEHAIKESKEYIKEDQLVISVIAGISTSFISRQLEQNNPVIRTMPNTSASIGQSATAIARGTFAREEHLNMAKQLFTAIGTVAVVEENHMHVVTGISGSGPAYFYYVVEAMQKAAVAEGLDEQTANELITQTIIGAGDMLRKSDLPAKTLRENVTSPNGTTAAGLHTLNEYKVEEAIINCVKSATARSCELGRKK